MRDGGTAMKRRVLRTGGLDDRPVELARPAGGCCLEQCKFNGEQGAGSGERESSRIED